MTRLSRHLRTNAIAYLALFVALGGTGYAAINLPAGSVGQRQIKNHSITPIKFDPGTIGASVRFWAIISDGNRVLASRPPGARVVWDPMSDTGVLRWNRPVPRYCFALATGNQVTVQTLFPPAAKKGVVVQFQSYDASGQHVSTDIIAIALLCPQP